jgi:N-acetylmuramoyl-L-alanine amidase
MSLSLTNAKWKRESKNAGGAKGGIMIPKKIALMVCATIVLMGYAREQKYNELKDIFLHQGKNDSSLEIGKLVLYFSDNAAFTLLPIPETQSSNKVLKSYFFPQTKVAINKKLQEAIERIQHMRHNSYAVHFALVSKPLEGIKVTVSYDPEKIEVREQFFNSIQLNKAIEIVFYNKELKKKLIMSVQAPVLRRAAQDKKKHGVVIDCGHGGSDVGAVGYGNLQEKEVTLSVGLRLAALLQQQHITVFLTRTTDATVPIDLRTTYANNLIGDADLLVSIHANMAKNEEACGIETYCLERSLFFPLPADALDKKFAYCVGKILNDRYVQSKFLAYHVQENMLLCMQKKNGNANDRQVKHAVAQILLGTQLPSALIEVGFLSNKYEAQLLRTKSYQQILAQGICNGILSYFHENA